MSRKKKNPPDKRYTELFDLLTAVMADVIEGSSDASIQQKAENGVMAAHFVLEVVKRWNTQEVPIGKCVNLAQQAMVKNIRLQAPNELRKALRETRDVFKDQEVVAVVEVEKATPETRRVGGSEKPAADGGTEEADGVVSAGEGQGTSAPEGERRGVGGEVQSGSRDSSYPYAKRGRKKLSDKPYRVRPVRGVSGEKVRSGGVESPTNNNVSAVQLEVSDVDGDLPPVLGGEGQGGGERDRVSSVPDGMSSLQRETKGTTARENSSPRNTDAAKKGGKKVTPEEAFKVLSGMSENEIKAKVEELRDGQRAAVQHLEEVDNPNKGAQFTGAVRQNDAVKRINCPNCSFDTMNYETKCVACGMELKPSV